MRTIVPIFALFAVFFSGSIAVAGPTAASRCQGVACDSDAAKKTWCTAIGKSNCSASDAYPDSKGDLSTCQMQRENALRAYDKLKTCGADVGSGDSPSMPSDPGTSSDPGYVPDPPKPNSTGIANNGQTLADHSIASSNNCAQLIGEFSAKVAACQSACHIAANNPVNNTPASGSMGPAVPGYGKSVAEDAEKVCAGLSAQQASDTKKGLDEAGKEANATRNAATGGGGSGSGGSGSSSGAGGNPMGALGQALGALGQAMQQQPQTNPTQDTTTADCSSNPMLAGCTNTPDSTSWNQATGTAGPQSTSDSNAQNFNTQDPNTGLPQNSTGNPYQAQSAYPGMANPIPPGGGGFMGGNGPGAQMGPQGNGGGGYYGASNRADILHGEHGGGGGYTQTLAGMDTKSGGGGGFSGYGSGQNQIDLKQFLPGGAKYAGARSPAGLAPASAQINSPQVNVWNRISERIRARCAEGRLRDCVP